jgi:hypothetical protein
MMIHFATAVTADPVREITSIDDWSANSRPSLLVVRDEADGRDEFLEAICEFVDVRLEYATSDHDIRQILEQVQPMAVVARLDGPIQDGFHVMKVVASYDRTLPILLLNDNDAMLLGAVDAIRELWGLRRVATVDDGAGTGPIADFIFNAARAVGIPGLMRL